MGVHLLPDSVDLIISALMLNRAFKPVVIFAVPTMTSRAKKAPGSKPASTKSKGKAKLVAEQPKEPTPPTKSKGLLLSPLQCLDQ